MSSLVFLGFSVILFIITYGIMFLMIPAILGPFFTALPVASLEGVWLDAHNEVETTLLFLIPLAPTIGIFILVIKVLMTASVRGRD